MKKIKIKKSFYLKFIYGLVFDRIFVYNIINKYMFLQEKINEKR